MIQYQLEQNLALHQGPVYALASGKDKSQFFSGGSDRKVFSWNLQDLEQPKLVANSPTTIISLHYIGESNHLLIGQVEGGIHVLDLEKSKEIHYLKLHQGYIFNMLQLPDKKELLAVSGDGSFSVWSTVDYRLLYHKKSTEKKIRGLDYSPERKELAIGLGNGILQVWDTVEWKLKNEISGFRSGINALKYDSHDRLFVGEKDAYLSTIDLKSGEILQSVPAHNWGIYDLIEGPSSQNLISASRDKTIKIWDSEKLEVVQRLEGFKDKAHTHSVNKLLPIGHEKQFLSTGDDGKIKLWSSL